MMETIRPTRLAAVLAVVVALSSVGGMAVPAGPAEVSQEGPYPRLPTVADAPPGTVFATHVPASGGGSRVVGLLKRGRSGNRLFNPASDLVRLRPGDGLLARSGQYYRVTVSQDLPGGTGVVGPGAVVYQGESDTEYVGFDTDLLVGTNETADLTLDLSGGVPSEQPTGRYLDPTHRRRDLTVVEPRVDNVRLISQRGGLIEPNGTVKADEFVIVAADVNFLDAARARFRLADPRTGETVTGGVLTRRGAIVRFPLSTPLITATIPEGQATVEEGDPTVRSLANPTLTQTVTVYFVQDSRPVVPPGGQYGFVVEADTRGAFGDLAAAGAREQVWVDLDRAGFTDERPRPTPPTQWPPYPTIRSPARTYVLGSVVDVNGTADPEVNAVAVYARPAGEPQPWELLSPAFSWVLVDADGTWAVPAVRLSAESWTLRRPGEYRVGVVRASRADRNGDTYADQRLTLGDFNQAGGFSTQLSVRGPETPSPPSTTTPSTATPDTPTTDEQPTATATPRPRPTTETAVAPTQSTTPQSTTTSDRPLDGFGPLTVLLAVVVSALVLLFRRRQR